MKFGLMAASIKSPLLPSNPSSAQHLHRPTTFTGRESFADSRKFTPRVTLEEGELLQRDASTAYSSSYRAVLSIENTYVDANDAKVQTYKNSVGSFRELNAPMTLNDESDCLPILTPSESLQFSLLMENLDSIADIFAGNDLVTLERDILVQIERLGAMKLFRASLFKIFMAPSVPNPEIQVLDYRDFPINHSFGEQKDRAIVRTGKREQRKLRRSRALDRTAKMSTPSASLRKVQKFEEPTLTFGSGWKGTSSMVPTKLKRAVVARNESQLSRGVKELADLHRICTKLEGQIGRAASYSKWAESAGMDQKALLQRLHFGWYCRDKLIKSTHSLVVYLARNYRGVGIAFDDLLQAGTMGVLKGAERYDHTRGYRFSTYVQYWIRKSMLALIARHSKGIQTPVKMHKLIKQIQIARRTYFSETGRYPRDEETADITGLSTFNVRLARKCSRVAGSIYQEMGIGWSTKYMEVTADPFIKSPEEIVTRQHMKNDVFELLESLHPKEKQVLILRYGLDGGRCKSLDEVGRHFSVTKEWIRQLQKTALAKLRVEDIQRELEYYLDK